MPAFYDSKILNYYNIEMGVVGSDAIKTLYCMHRMSACEKK